MGVPSFFRWLVQRYPKVIVDAVDDGGRTQDDGVPIPVRIQDPNPNGQEFDNLYLDMNGIIHPCCHPENGKQPDSEADMMKNVLNYIDHIVSIVRPRKILYMAIDGVAPRAKMNQQRARRFVAAKEREENAALRNDMIEQWRAEGLDLPFDSDVQEWDSNVITPGTPFMAKLADVLRYYVVQRIHSDPGWKGLKVIFSDASCPGEGEHKIMSFIRRQRAMPSYDPNTSHVLYGMDADLIMLGLATHDPHFCIIREKVDFESKKCNLCGSEGHFQWECSGDAKKEASQLPENQSNSTQKKAVEYQLLRISVLREYLEHDLVPLQPLPFPWNFENAIDDFVMLCFFVGNDFLPHLPSLEIREGAIGNLMALWRTALPTLGGYLTKNGIVNIKRLSVILSEIGKLENDLLKSRARGKAIQGKREKEREEQKQQLLNKIKKKKKTKNSNNDQDNGSEEEEKEAEKKFNEDSSFKWNLKKKLMDNNRIADPQDSIRLGDDGWERRYYLTKLRMDQNKEEDQEELQRIHREYIMGLSWVLQYYYRGVASWSWYFPYHYSPFATGLGKASDSVEFQFRQGAPFRPLDQLMGVLPSQSAHALPESYGRLMTDDTQSSITKFYPTKFEQDINGKRYMWQAVALLPFIDEKMLLDAIAPVERLLTPEEQQRNAVGREYVYFHSGSAMANAYYAASRDADGKKVMSENDIVVYEVSGGDPEALRYDSTLPEEPDVLHASLLPPSSSSSSSSSSATETKSSSSSSSSSSDTLGQKRSRPEPTSTDEDDAEAGNAKRRKTGTEDLTNSELCVEINPIESNGLTGFLVPYKEAVLPYSTVVPSPFADHDPRYPDLKKLRVMSAVYVMPRARPHYCGLLPGLRPPEQKLLRDEDFLPDTRFRLARVGPAKQMYRQGGFQRSNSNGGHNNSHHRSQGNYRQNANYIADAAEDRHVSQGRQQGRYQQHYSQHGRYDNNNNSNNSNNSSSSSSRGYHNNNNNNSNRGSSPRHYQQGSPQHRQHRGGHHQGGRGGGSYHHQQQGNGYYDQRRGGRGGQQQQHHRQQQQHHGGGRGNGRSYHDNQPNYNRQGPPPQFHRPPGSAPPVLPHSDGGLAANINPERLQMILNKAQQQHRR